MGAYVGGGAHSHANPPLPPVEAPLAVSAPGECIESQFVLEIYQDLTHLLSKHETDFGLSADDTIFSITN